VARETLYQELQNPALIRGLAHPLRTQMLAILLEREASPKELAEEFDVPLANVAYHIQVLRKLKLIRLVRKTPRRGAVEHHYRADKASHIDNVAWAQVPDQVKESVVAAGLNTIATDVGDAAASGGFDQKDIHLSRQRLVLDQEAWNELGDMLQSALDRGYELEKEAAERLKKKDHEGERRAGVVMLLYETMPTVPGADAAKHPGKSRSQSPEPSEVTV
jgi:DNA-binding transcriptional ArsR family regulator